MFDLKAFLRIRGGVHPEGHKHLTSETAIADDLPIAKKLYIPLQQHVGKAAEPAVKVGDKVLKGQLLASSQGRISAPVHAPSSGTVVDINHYPAPHPSALPILTVVIETDGEDKWCDLDVVADPFVLSPEEVSDRIAQAGIVGLGGATFPSAVKLSLARKSGVETLLINGGECEPYLTCDDRLMQERAIAVLDGVALMLHGLQAKEAIVAIEDNKPNALAMMKVAAEAHDNIRGLKVPTHYPMGWDRQLIKVVTGKEVPAGSRATEVGVLMHNVGTAYAVHRALRFGEPLVRRVVTVSGDAVNQPRNIEVPIGTLIEDVFNSCEADTDKAARIVMGGPMMGEAMPHTRLPIVKATSGVLALSEEQIKVEERQPCIRCASCVQACPVGLPPVDMMNQIRVSNFDNAIDLGLKDCISCGTCSYVCPSNIPLVHYFKFASGELLAREQTKHKAEQTKKLIDARNERHARIKREKAEEAARRKVEKEARARARAEKAAAKQKEAAS